MDRYVLGQCLTFLDPRDDENIIYCEILGYRGSEEYYVSLTRGIVDVCSAKYPPVCVLHSSVIEAELAALDQ